MSKIRAAITGYSATIGPDPCTGLGRPLPTLFSSLTGSDTPPPPPPTQRTFKQRVNGLLNTLIAKEVGNPTAESSLLVSREIINNYL